MNGRIVETAHWLLEDIARFAWRGSALRLRAFQRGVANAILRSVLNHSGDTLVVMFPRQSGKNELQAHIECFLLALYAPLSKEIVKASPTFKPQTMNAMRRLERVLDENLLTKTLWKKERGYIFSVLKARIFFLSGAPTSNVVGATANLLLQCDEAQDVRIEKWDKEFAPMAASTNATRVFWGTAWTRKTLLARELRIAREKQNKDGRQRVFVITADDVRKEVPAYGKYVDEQIARLGRNHPLIKTQYFSEEIDAEGRMFDRRRKALMQGSHAMQDSPEEDQIYCLLLDVAGEDESASDDLSELSNAGRDLTALTVAQVDLSTLEDDLIGAPTYKVVNRYSWIGDKHTELYGQIKALAEHWKALYLVVDATGVGAGLASFLDSALPGVVVPFIFTLKSKSDLGWNFLAVIETGRYKEYVSNDTDKIHSEFWRQVETCQHTVKDGPGKILSWGVPDGTRDMQDGELIHDDLLISAALCSVLDTKDWGTAKSEIVASIDPMDGMDDAF